MDIKASYNWIKEYLSTDLSAEDFAREVSLRSMSVESIRDLAQEYSGMVVGEVRSIKAHPNADKLKIVVTNIGERDVEIICGGSNLAEGMKVFVALPGSKVRWHGEGDLVELAETKIRGESSYGMICAPEEVGFEKAPCPKDGIWDLTGMVDAPAGTPIAKALGLEDILFDIEITTNRPDAMGVIGLAREGAASTSGTLKAPRPPVIPKAGSSKPLSVSVKDRALCPRYMAVVIDGVKVGPSPLWLQMRLLLTGHRPINNIVDITNYVLREYGQPMHAFDYDKLASGEIIVRRARDGEKMEALDENEYELKSDHLVIADRERPVAVAGVMGGQYTGTTDETTTIVFEAASFEPVSVRRTSRALNLQSDSQQLFEKGLSTDAPHHALARAVELTLEIAGGEVASEVVDVRAEEYRPLVFPLRPAKVRERIGADIGDHEMVEILTRLGFAVDQSGPPYSVTVPYWRDHDIEAEVDLSEEIARIYGYHNLENVIPDSAPPQTLEDPALALESGIKHLLKELGYTELFSYSFVSESDLSRYDLDPAEAVPMYNPLTSDLTHLRPSLIPSVLSSINENQGRTPRGNIFELSRTYTPRPGNLPLERSELVVAQYGIEDVELAYRELRGVLEAITERNGIELRLQPAGDDVRWDAGVSSALMLEGDRVGYLGRLAGAYQKAFGIDRSVMMIILDLETLIPKMHRTARYEPVPEFPAADRDLAIAVPEPVTYGQIEEVIKSASQLIASIELVEIYRGKGVEGGKKSLTIALKLRAADRTLESSEVDEVMKSIARMLQDQFGAILR